MHKLDRATVAPPPCLAGYNYRTQNWDDFTHDGSGCKRALRIALQRMQAQSIPNEATSDEYFIFGLRCAYCEGTIYYGGHIEHFRRKNPAHFPKLTFDWNNLFLACGSEEHCGHYKDRPGAPVYDHAELIKPDIHDPDDCLYFHSTGEVRVRNTNGTTAANQRRGSETIRVFNLNYGSLRGARNKALKVYLDKDTKVLDEIITWEDELRRQYFAEEIEKTKWDPFSTTIKHFLQKLG